MKSLPSPHDSVLHKDWAQAEVDRWPAVVKTRTSEGFKDALGKQNSLNHPDFLGDLEIHLKSLLEFVWKK